MQKNITKCFIFLLLTCNLFTFGCSKRNTDLIIYEPDKPMLEENADAFTGDSLPEDTHIAEGSGEGTKSSTAVSSAEAEKSESTQKVPEENSDVPESVMVHVCGAVLCEGVYELPAGSRVVDAIKAAGGFLKDADSDFVNQALVLEDGIKIKIPTLEETAGQSESVGESLKSDSTDQAGITGMSSKDTTGSKKDGGKININSATEDELCTIPGIGPSKAKSIIAYRDENGKFGTIEDIMKVTGIKDKFFSKIKDHITV